MSDCLILAHNHGRYLADNLQDDSIDVVYESGADLDRLRQFVPSDVRKYKVRDSFSIFFCYKTSIQGVCEQQRRSPWCTTKHRKTKERNDI